jgi:hypothetical protein
LRVNAALIPSTLLIGRKTVPHSGTRPFAKLIHLSSNSGTIPGIKRRYRAGKTVRRMAADIFGPWNIT